MRERAAAHSMRRTDQRGRWQWQRKPYGCVRWAGRHPSNSPTGNSKPPLPTSVSARRTTSKEREFSVPRESVSGWKPRVGTVVMGRREPRSWPRLLTERVVSARGRRGVSNCASHNCQVAKECPSLAATKDGQGGESAQAHHLHFTTASVTWAVAVERLGAWGLSGLGHLLA